MDGDLFTFGEVLKFRIRAVVHCALSFQTGLRIHNYSCSARGKRIRNSILRIPVSIMCVGSGSGEYLVRTVYPLSRSRTPPHNLLTLSTLEIFLIMYCRYNSKPF